MRIALHQPIPLPHPPWRGGCFLWIETTFSNWAATTWRVYLLIFSPSFPPSCLLSHLYLSSASFYFFFTHTHIYIYIYIYTHTHTHTHTRTNNLSLPVWNYTYNITLFLSDTTDISSISKILCFFALHSLPFQGYGRLGWWKFGNIFPYLAMRVNAWA